MELEQIIGDATSVWIIMEQYSTLLFTPDCLLF